MNDHYQELQDLFPLDPLLVFSVGYVCPKSDIAEICRCIHIPYAIALVCEKLDTIRFLSSHGSNEVRLSMISDSEYC